MTVIVPQLVRRRVVGVKVEATPGTAVTPAGADATFHAYDFTCQPDAEFEDRKGQLGFGRIPGTLGMLTGTAKFKTELTGGASAPQWASVLLPACGFPFTSLVSQGASRAPSVSGVTTVTIYGWEDGVLKAICGAAGNPKMTFPAGKRCIVEWEFKGIWIAPTTVSLPAPTFTTVAPLRFVSSALLVAGAWTPRVSAMSLDFGNKVEIRADGTSSTGALAACITDRRIVGKFDPESGILSTNDTYGQWLAGTSQSLAFALGSTGNKIAFAAQGIQITKPQEGSRNDLQTDDVDFLCLDSADGADDALTMTFS